MHIEVFPVTESRISPKLHFITPLKSALSPSPRTETKIYYVPLSRIQRTKDKKKLTALPPLSLSFASSWWGEDFSFLFLFLFLCFFFSPSQVKKSFNLFSGIALFMPFILFIYFFLHACLILSLLSIITRRKKPIFCNCLFLFLQLLLRFLT